MAGQGPSGAPKSAIILRTVATGMFPAPLPKNVLVHERARACGCVFFFSSFFVMCLYVGALALASARHARTARVAPVVCFHRNPSLSCGVGGDNGQLKSLQSVCLSRSQFIPPQKNLPLKARGLDARRVSGLAVSEHFIHTQGLRSKATETCHNTQTTQLSEHCQNR